MKKNIFILDNNKIKKTTIFIDENVFCGLLENYNVDNSNLIFLSQMLITLNDSLEISKVLRKISEYHPDSILDKMIKNKIISAIDVGEVEFSSILYSEDEISKNILYLIREKVKSDNVIDDDCSELKVNYSSDFNYAISKRIEEIEKCNIYAFSLVEQIDNILFSKAEVKQYKKRVVKALPYTKRRKS